MAIFSTVEIIKQIKAVDNGQTFKLVGGAAQIARLLDMENINQEHMPFCGVVPSEGQTTDNEALNGTWQTLTEYFNCVIILDNTRNNLDTAGQTCVVDFYECRDALFKCIYNWNPSFNITKPISFDGYELDSLTVSRIVYKATFKCEITISSDDGYQSPQFPDWGIDKVEVDADPVIGSNHLITE